MDTFTNFREISIFASGLKFVYFVHILYNHYYTTNLLWVSKKDVSVHLHKNIKPSGIPPNSSS